MPAEALAEMRSETVASADDVAAPQVDEGEVSREEALLTPSPCTVC